MIINLIESYILTKVNELNSRYDLNLQSLQSEFIDTDFDKTPNAQAENNFQISIENIVNNFEYENTNISEINISIDFSFLLPKNLYSDYKDILNKYMIYLYNLLNERDNFYYEEPEAYGLSLLSIKQIELTNGRRVDKGYYKPTIKAQYLISIFDNNKLMTTKSIIT